MSDWHWINQRTTSCRKCVRAITNWSKKHLSQCIAYETEDSTSNAYCLKNRLRKDFYLMSPAWKGLVFCPIDVERNDVNIQVGIGNNYFSILPDWEGVYLRSKLISLVDDTTPMGMFNVYISSTLESISFLHGRVVFSFTSSFLALYLYTFQWD